MQQVNLLNTLPEVQTQRFTASLMLRVLTIFFVFLSCIYGYQQWLFWKDTQSFEKLKQREFTAAEHFKSVAQYFPTLAQDEPLETQIEALANEIEEKSGLVDLLMNRSTMNGFSTYLEALARQFPEGLWVRSIKIIPGQDQISIKGFSSDAMLVPQFIQNLHREKAFANEKLHVFDLARSKQQTEQIEFVFGTHSDDQ